MRTTAPRPKTAAVPVKSPRASAPRVQKPSVETPRVKTPRVKTPQATPLRAKAPRPAAATPPAPRPTPVVALSGGQAWKMNGRYGVAYVRDAALARELLAVEPKQLARAAMAVYYDKKGRAFAWQVRFDTERWDDVLRRLA